MSDGAHWCAEDDGKPIERVKINHYFFTSDERYDLRRAHELSRAIEDMQREIDSLLDPKAKKVAKLKDHLEVEELLKLFPSGFHRLELGTWANILKRVNEV